MSDTPVLQRGGIRAALVPALVCSALSVALMRTGFMAFFFLVPLGYAASYGSAVAWFSCAVAVVINAAVSLALGQSGAGGSVSLNILLFAVLGLGFTWVMAGGLVKSVSTAGRFVVAASASALCLLGLALHIRHNPAISGMLRSQAELVSSLYLSGADAARQPLLERILSPDKIIASAVSTSIRGGLLVLVFFLFFVSRQASFVIAGIFRRRKKPPALELAAFHAPSKTIWVLSFALAGILLGRALESAEMEIAMWNVLAVCAILFLAQGGGIVLYALTRRSMPLLPRLLFAALIVAVTFRPILCMIALGVLLLLGIAENWLPLRAPKQDGSAPTPEP